MVLNFKQLENNSSFAFDCKNKENSNDNYSVPAHNATNKHDMWLHMGTDSSKFAELWACLDASQPPAKVLEMWDDDYKLAYRVFTANGATVESYYNVRGTLDFKIVVLSDTELQFVCLSNFGDGGFSPGDPLTMPKITWRMEPRPEIPEPPLTPSLLQLAATKFNDFTVALLNGGKYAKQKTPAGGYLYHIADPAAINAWLGNEWKFGIVPGWPESLRNMIGPGAINTVMDEATYRKIRTIWNGELIPDSAMARHLPDISDKVNAYTDSWAAAKEVKFHPAVRVLVFDVLFNVALRMNLSKEEVDRMALVCVKWSAASILPDITSDKFKPIFDEGMKARAEMAELFLQKLKDPNLPKGLGSAVRDAFGLDSVSTVNTCFAVIFGGLETGGSVIANLIRLLAANPTCLAKVKEEASAVVGKYGSLASTAAQNELKFTLACWKETARMTYAVGSVPRFATLPINTPVRCAELPGKCPFMLDYKAMGALDPTVAGSKDEFKPDRWLTAEGATNYDKFQHPLGAGMRFCPGSRIITALGVTTAARLATSFKYTVDANTEFSDAGIPANGLPGVIERA